MNEYTPEFLAAALIAYMDTFQVYQDDCSAYDEATGERVGSFIGRHVFIGHEIPSMQGFSVHMKVPIKKLQSLYNTRATSTTDCPWVEAVDIFKSFMETTIASAAAFDLINSGFAKDVMKQWLGWRTDTITIDDQKASQLTATEAANRIQSILAVAFKGQPVIDNANILEHKPDPAPVVVETTKESAAISTQLLAEAVSAKRRPRKYVNAD